MVWDVACGVAVEAAVVTACVRVKREFGWACAEA